MSAPEARPSRRTAATRERLYSAAIDLFGERGIDQVTVEQIATAAGVAKGTVYYNFPGKEALVSGLFYDRTSAIVTAIEHVRGNDGGTAELIDALLGFVEEQPTFIQLLAGELWRPASRWRSELADIRERLIVTMQPLVARDRPQDDETAHRIQAGAVLVTVLGIGLDWRAYNATRDRAEISTQLRTLFTSQPDGP